MRVTPTKAAVALVASGLFAFSSSALATNGYFTHGVGTESKGMAGTGVGSPENMGGISAATNPALGVFADESWQFGLAIFSPMRSYEASASFANGNFGALTLSQGKHDSKNEAFPIPYLAKNWELSADSALSLVFYGRGGMNTEWDSGQSALFDPTGQGGAPGTFPGVYGAGKAGVDLMQAFLSVNYARKLTPNLAIGIGPVVAAQMFEATGVATFAPYTQTFADAFLQNGMGAPVTSLTDNGSDMSTGFGVAVGLWAGSDTFSVGLAYQSKLSMSEFDDYADLFAQDGGFDIPSSIKAGLSFKPGESARVNVDIEHIAYSDVDSVHNPIVNLLTGCFTANPGVAPATNGCLGGPNGAGFGWDDVTVYKLGFEWAANEDNTWRIGYSFGDQPIPRSEMLFNILAPGVMEQHMTVGWTRRRANGHTLSLSMMYAPSFEIQGPSTFDPTQTITLEMSQFEFEVAYRF